MDELTQLQAQRQWLQGELAAIEQAIRKSEPGAGEAQFKQMTVTLKSHFARLRVVDARLTEIHEAVP